MGNSCANIVCIIPSTAKKIIEFHEPKPLNSLGLGSIVSKAYTKLLYYRTIEKTDIIVTLTKDSISKWGKARHVEITSNFSTIFVSNLVIANKNR